jgi:hypothetical protein
VRGIGDEVGPEALLALLHERNEAVVVAQEKRPCEAHIMVAPHPAAAGDRRVDRLTRGACGRLRPSP